MIQRPPAAGTFLGSRFVARVTRVVGRLKKVSLPLAFVTLALPVGTFLVFAQPPGQGLDEASHFFHVWALAHGSVVAPIHHGIAGSYIPQCVVEYIKRFSTEASRHGPFSFSQYWQSPVGCSQQPRFTNLGSIPAYGPISYVPSIITVAILHGIGAPLPVIFFGGRLASLLGFVVLFSLAIRLTPVGKQVLFVLGLLPTTLLLASSYSADPVTISLAALSVALTLRCCLTSGESRGTVLLLFLVLLGLCLTKPNLFPFAFLLFMVPTTAIGPLRYSPLVRTGAVGVILAGAGLWYIAVRHVVGAPVPQYGLNPHVQAQFHLHHPVAYIKVLARTIFESKGEAFWISGFFFSIGYFRPFGADNIFAPIGIIIVGSLTLWYAFQLQLGLRRVVMAKARVIAWLPIALMGAEVFIIETSLFLYGTPVGSPITLAQGRYFLPVLTLPLLTIALLQEARVRPRSTRWIILGSVTMLVWLVLKIFVHDYTL